MNYFAFQIANECNLKTDQQNEDGPVDDIDHVEEVADVRIESLCDDGEDVVEEGEDGRKVEQTHVRLHRTDREVLFVGIKW